MEKLDSRCEKINTELLGKWSSTEDFTNNLGTVQCHEVLAFTDCGTLNWCYYETGAPDEMSAFFYRICDDKLFLRSNRFLSEIEVLFGFDDLGHLHLTFDEGYTLKLVPVAPACH